MMNEAADELEKFVVTAIVQGAIMGIEKATGTQITHEIAVTIVNAFVEAFSERGVDYQRIAIELGRANMKAKLDGQASTARETPDAKKV